MLLLQLDSQNASKDASQEKLEKGSVWDAKKIGQEILLPIIAFLCLCVCLLQLMMLSAFSQTKILRWSF